MTYKVFMGINPLVKLWFISGLSDPMMTCYEKIGPRPIFSFSFKISPKTLQYAKTPL